jgi:AcrR family transcriptional regulator
MHEKRAQGRPGRGTDEVGKTKVIEGTRAFLRSQSRDLTRKDIAEFIGVTPALVSYYFPERFELVEAATAPVVADHADRLQSVVRSHVEPHEKLRRVISSLIDLHFQDGKIVDYFSAHVAHCAKYKGANHYNNVLREVSAAADEYLRQLGDAPFSAEFIAISLWGICKFVAQEAQMMPALGRTVPYDKEEGMDADRVDQAERVFWLMTAGTSGMDRSVPSYMALPWRADAHRPDTALSRQSRQPRARG